MLRDALIPPLRQLRTGDWLPAQWRAPLAILAFSWGALGIAFVQDWAAIANQAWNSSTYNHIILIPAILAWLVAMRAKALARLEPKPWWPALILSASAGILWLLGAFSGLDLARQLGAVLLLVSTVPLLLGLRVGAGLLFPLAYMLLLVPFGDELIPPLQMITAAITIALTDLSGIPAVIDGVFIDTPAGLFEVAEACSGVKFLIAMIAYGLLVANVCFLSWKRRFVFMAACVVVPILANGVRAWGTIFAAQYIGAEAAAGFDHLVYGWIFFAVVLAAVTAGAWRYFDRPVDDPMIDAEEIAGSPLLARLSAYEARPVTAIAALVLVTGAMHVWARTAETLEAPVPPNPSLPEVAGWQRVPYEPAAAWKPLATGAEHRLIGRYRNADGKEVDVFVAVYSGQGEGREAGGFGEGALIPGNYWSWLADGPSFGNGKSERLLAEGRFERLAVTWYRTGSLRTGSNMRLKLANMQDRLLLTARPTTTLILSAEVREGNPAEQSIREFIRDSAPIDAWMDRMAGVE